MKIFFSMSFRGNLEIARKIIGEVKKIGHKVLNEDNFDDQTPYDFYKWTADERLQYLNKVFELLKQSDIAILDCTMHSLTIGQMIQEAIKLNKPLLLLNRFGSYLPILDGISKDNNNVLKVDYELENINHVLKDGLLYLSNQAPFRFTMLLEPDIKRHLDNISAKGITRSQYIRKLILDDINRQ